MSRKSLSTRQMLDSEEQFGAAYKQHAQPIYQFFYWRTGDVQLSEDLTSGVFEKAWRSRQSFKSGSIKAWLYKIARNLLIDHWRAKTSVLLEDEDNLVSEQEAISELLDKQFMAQRLYNGLDKLGFEMRAVIQLRFIENQPVKQVAQRLGLSESNVRVIQYRALKKMRQYLDE